MTKYKASLDHTTRWTSIAFSLLVVILIGRSIQILQNNNFILPDAPMYYFSIIILITIWLISFLRKIKYYELFEDKLIIKTRWKDKIIPLNEITKIEPLNLLPFASLKNIGRRALFTYRGRYHFPELGYVNFYASQKKNLLFLQTKEHGNIVISPNSLALLEEIKKKI